MRLDKRLELCAELVSGDTVCDIGTDHGMLPAHLILTGKCRNAIAADINKKPLAAAEALFEREGISDKVRLYLTNGLLGIPLEGVTDIVIAGMGGELISDIILSDGRTRDGDISFILQPMTRDGILRRRMAENGFETVCERAVSESRFVYTVIKYRYTGNVRDISLLEEKTGLLDPALPDDGEFIKRRLSALRKAAEGMRNSDPDKAAEISAEADMTERFLREGRKQ